MIEEFLFIILGIFLGCFAGLVPGIHTNLLCTILLSFFFTDSSLNLSLLIISMSITHSFASIIPSLFLGIPDNETVFALLPGHKLVKKGIGFEAIKLYLLGGFFSLIFVILISPILFFILPKMFFLVKNKIKFFLLLIIIILVLKEKSIQQKVLALFVFFASGILGYLTLNKLNEPLLVLFSGFFAVSSLFFSFYSVFPKQFITDIIRIKKSDTCFSLFFITFSCALINLFPGLGISQSISLARFFYSRINNYIYLFMIGGVNVIDFVFSLFTFYLFNKHRNGSIVAVSSFIPELDVHHLVLFLSLVLFVSGIAVIITLFFTKTFIKYHDQIKIKSLNKSVLIFILVLVFYFSGFLGLFVLLLAALIGAISQISGICRSHAMGCLLLVVLLN